MAAARTVEEFAYYHTSVKIGQEVFPEVTQPPIIMMLRDFDDQKLMYIGGIEIKEMTAFFRDHQLPILATFDQETVSIVFQKGEKKGVILVHSGKDSDAAIQQFRQLAREKKSQKYVFMTASSKDEWGQRLVSFFGLSESELPIVEIVDVVAGEPRRYRHTGAIKADALATFLEDYEEGKIEKYVKSEEVPSTNPGPVIKAVGKTFKSEVIENDMDVLVKFYAEWCGHCKKLAPVYEALAKKLQNNKRLKFVEIDSTKNDVEGHTVQSYPTLKFFAGRDKTKAIDFTGERTEEGILKFLKEKCSYQIEEGKTDL